MVGWFGAAALALVGGLKGQGSPWRQIPIVGVLAATALFISWRVRHRSEKDTSKAKGDDKTVAEVNTREYLVYDEEKKLECSASLSQSPPAFSELELEKFTDTDDLGSTSVEAESLVETSEISQSKNYDSENTGGGGSLSRTVIVSNGDGECKDVEEISKPETTSHGVKTSGPKPSPAVASRITDISVSGLLLPQMRSQKFFIHSEIPSVVGERVPYVYELDSCALKDATGDSLSYCPVVDMTHDEKDIIPVIVSDVASNTTPKDECSSTFLADGGSRQRIAGQMERLENLFKLVDSESPSTWTAAEKENEKHESESGIVAISDKNRTSPEVREHPSGGFSNHSSGLTHALSGSGVRKGEATSDRGSSTLREVRAPWISPELQLNDWISRRGDSEVEDGRLARPASAAESYPSPVADSIPGAFPFSSYSTSESCSSDVVDSKDEFLLQSPSNNVKRIISHVKDLQPDSKKSSEVEYAERLRTYDEYLADPSLSPTMKSQVLRAKATLERMLYDSD